MKEIIQETLAFVIKWGLLVIIAGIVFYCACPKYYMLTESTRPSSGQNFVSHGKMGAFRINIFTGETLYVPAKD